MSNAMRAADQGPNIIDVTDLRHPVLSEVQKQAIAAAEAMPMTFDADRILQEARDQTGLSDFGADDFRERLQLWCEVVDEDDNIAALRRLSLYQMYLRYAVSRLRVEDFIKRHPAVLDVKIDRPIIVAGLPRSGTTHLVSLISADTRLRSLPWWEAIAPVPTPADEPTASDPNPRRTREAAVWDGADALLPYMKAMHEFSPDHISEDIELTCLDFSSYMLEWLFHAPRWRDYYLSHDQSGPYAYLKKCLQLLSYIRGPNRWVIKCPQHLEQLPVLRKTFPDATYVLTHRDPVASVQSAITMSCYTARVFRKQVDADQTARYWVDRYRRLLERCVRDRDCLPEAQTLDGYFHEWTKDQDRILRAIYQRAGIPLTDNALAELHAYIEAHEAGHQGKVVYDLRRDFGLDPNEVRKNYQFYFDRFPVKPEVF